MSEIKVGDKVSVRSYIMPSGNVDLAAMFELTGRVGVIKDIIEDGTSTLFRVRFADEEKDRVIRVLDCEKLENL